MIFEAALSMGALGPARPLHLAQAGASLCFEGVVRDMEDGRPLEALMYESYDPMTLRELETLGRDVATRHGLLGLSVEHSKGPVPAGQVSFRLQVASVHRAESIRAIDEFINRLKREVPLWKVPVWRGGEVRT